MVISDKIKTRSYAEMASQIEAVATMGRWIAHSRMFGCQTEEQGCVIAADCFITGMPLLEYQARNSLVMGRPSIPYDAMLAAFREKGGKTKINSKTADLASITLAIDDEAQEFSLSWEDAQKEAFPYLGKEDDIVAQLTAGNTPPLKPKYATPRSRAIMMFARVVSDGIRTLAPEVNFGSYTPEEIEDFAKPETNGSAVVAKAETAREVTVRVDIPSQSTKSATKETTETKQASDDPAARNTSTGKQSMANNEPLTKEQKSCILELMGRLKQAGMNDIAMRVKDKLAACGMSALADLTISEGDSMIRALEMKQIEAWAESQIKGHAAQSPT